MTLVATQISADGTVGSDSDLAGDIGRLAAAIASEASSIDRTLGEHPCRFEGGDLLWSGQTQHRELRRQLGALRGSVTRAQERSEGDATLLRAELATLLSFAKTLAADSLTWRGDFEAGLRELERREAAAREQRERLTAEREVLIGRRDALQANIDRAARLIAAGSGGEYRRTVPCVALGERVTVVSQWVLCPRKGLRSEKHWLVTLDGAGDQVLVRRCYA
jgi:hypothetical protein